MIYKRIYFYLDKKKLIYSKQFGFRANFSTNHAIISLTEHIRKLLDNGDYVCGVFVDLEKAFDTVHHEILCEKIKAYGLRGNVNNLLKSYLSDRKQCQLMVSIPMLRMLLVEFPKAHLLGRSFFCFILMIFSFVYLKLVVDTLPILN